MKKIPWKSILLGITMFIIGAFLGARFFSADSVTVTRTLTGDVRDRVVSTNFTNPLLECAELPESISVGERIDLESEIEKFINTKKSEGVVTEASVYFRDLNNGPWFGIQEEYAFSPGSLLKVPLAMWYYWKADTDVGLLDQEIEFVGPRGVSIVHFPPKKQLNPGTIYRVDDLIRMMLQESDNDAAVILAQFAGANQTNEVYQDLGVKPLENAQTYTINVHTFASFFRILYNATYLGRALSEHILEIMNESSFKDGIVAGLPQHVRVAHKFGEREISPGNYQLHDCGIVYAGANPYSLCIMTQGKEYDALAGFIAEISRIVYEGVAQ